MPVRNESRHHPRVAQADIDRHAIRVAVHLLMTGIWVERQCAQAPKMLGRLVVADRWRRSTAVSSGAGLWPVSRPGQEEPTSDSSRAFAAPAPRASLA